MKTEPREFSGVTAALVLRHVQARAGEDAAARVRAAAGPLAQDPRLTDPCCWYGRATVLALLGAAVDVLDDPEAAVAVGLDTFRDPLDEPMLRMLQDIGSPRGIYLGLPLVNGRFVTTASLEVVDSAYRRVTLRHRTHAGYAPSRLECDFVRGMLAAVPTLVGRPPAHVRHTRCQAEGADACEFRATWAARRRPAEPTMRTTTAAGLAALRAQLDDLQRTATELVSGDDIETVLARVVDRAAAAVSAPGAVVVLDTGGGTLVRSRGLAPERVREVQAMLTSGEVSPEVVVAEIASARRTHGTLAAVHHPGHVPAVGSGPLLGAYAAHAAAALDLVLALEDSRREATRATALLSLADALAAAPDAAAVGRLVADALLDIVGCDQSSVMLWEPAGGELRAIAAGGMTPEAEREFLATTVRADTTPELAAILARHEPVLITAAEASGELAALLQRLDVGSVVVVPLLADQVLMGVATASWVPDGPAPVALDAAVLARAAGVSVQAATALQNARLRATVQHQASHDPLTGLPNRTRFTRTLDDVLRVAQPTSGTAVLSCDLDRFANVNVSRGHRAGDELLRQAAARLRGALRPSDVVARLNGDEFAILLEDAGTEDRAVAVARRLVEVLDEPFRIDGRELRITSSVGVAVHEGVDGRGERLLAAATTAQREAKARGRNEVAVAGEVEHGHGSPSLEAELGRAIGGGQLRLFFQPVLDLSEGGRVVVGAEALIRWAHPRLGLLAPGSFLPVAEESGLVTEIDLWALQAACDALAGWPSIDGRPLGIAVNLAGATLVDPRLVPAVRAALARNDLAPERLALEVVESRSLTDLPGVVDRMVELRQMGVRISLDDFGTGYSTMAWLHALPVDQIKIDRSFIMTLPDDGAAIALVRGMLALARELGLEVIAEGVEEPEQLATLREVGCDRAQGYLLGRPAPQLDTTSVRADRPRS